MGLFRKKTNLTNYSAYSTVDVNFNYKQQVHECYRYITNPFNYYRFIIEELSKLDKIELLPLYEFAKFDNPGKIAIGLRHDIDADPWTGVRCARFLAQQGICGSFYLLHTALYYGSFLGNSFIRTAEIGRFVSDFIIAGAEIGLHNDAFYLETQHGLNGAEGVAREIEWLRERGAAIRGTVAHNSFPIYEAENYEIFQERVLWKRKKLTKDGFVYSFGKLSEKILGLEYEGTFAQPKKVESAKIQDFLAKEASLKNQVWVENYLFNSPYCDYAVDLQCWLVGKDKWIISGNTGNGIFEYEIDFLRLLELISSRPTGERILLVLHPCYFRE